jgi:hypothetical protein
MRIIFFLRKWSSFAELGYTVSTVNHVKPAEERKKNGKGA